MLAFYFSLSLVRIHLVSAILVGCFDLGVKKWAWSSTYSWKDMQTHIASKAGTPLKKIQNKP
jgi:hypothetical protein